MNIDWDLVFVLGFVGGMIFLCVGLPILVIEIHSIWSACDGEHTGIVTAVEKVQTMMYSGNIAFIKTSSESTQEDKYCVNDKSVVDKLKEYAKTRQPVTVYYRNDWLVWRSQCDGGETIVYDVLPANITIS